MSDATARGREFDVVVWGATGFTGRLVAEYLLGRHGVDGPLRWALGGRDAAKLARVRDEIGRSAGVAAAGLPLVVGDAADAASLAALAQRARVVCTTVGPYAKYGSGLVAACAREGTHYCDLTGELPWMRRMIDAHEEQARASGARIVHNCGFDSIPSDLGVHFLQREMRERFGAPSPRVRYRVKGFRGGFSGGTIASLLNVLEEASRDPSVRLLMADPYALDPSDRRGGRDGPDRAAPAWDDIFRQWTGPFVMGPLDTRVVRRTNALSGCAYGREFRYDEAVLTGAGPLGLAKATVLAAASGGTMAALRVGALRRALAGRLPGPGEGPSRERQAQGYFDIRLHAAHPSEPAQGLYARVTGDRDPGYGSTAKMLGESAVCLALDPLAVGGGFWTPAAGLGDALLDRLRAHAGLTFEVVSGPDAPAA